jgi:hypothetical protein
VKTYVRNCKNDGVVGKLGCVLVWRGRVVGRGATLYPNIHNIKKYDIS